MTGFGLVRPLPGLSDSLRINTAITLPVGVEAYGAYAAGHLAVVRDPDEPADPPVRDVGPECNGRHGVHARRRKRGAAVEPPPFSVADCRTSD
jgi:hypothetical protein